VAVGTDDAHGAGRLVLLIRRKLDHYRVLDEVPLLGVLVDVESGRLEGLGRLAQAVRKVELDDCTKALVEPAEGRT
jgi:hypothetical protein